MLVNVDNKIEVWKNKLLDLGKRNRLINYHETKRSTLSIKIPEIFDLWESFVKRQKPLEFPYFHEDEESGNENIPLDKESYPVVTNQSINDLQKTLHSLRNKANTALNEQGINILYLAFGFLDWTETNDSEQHLYSPLILVPAKLKLESITSPYVLELYEDEMVFNPALAYKMQNDFGLTFPDFDEETDLKGYFDSIKALVKSNKWNVVEKVGLSLFSFLKINMYNDLDKHKNEIKDNSVVRGICGDASAVEQIPEDLENFDFDKKLKPEEMFQIVDADSSQQDAVLLAKSGVSFVLQGPPGTGKSQTITNIIAECLADGKKVLFVSEKMAALDVVHRRLTSAGLNDFCLVLHSHKANKKAVLEQLRIVLDLAKNKVQLSDEAFIKLNELYRDKEKLNNYAEQVFTTIQPLNKTIYEVNGILAGLQEYEDVIFDIKDIRNTTFEQYQRYLYVLKELSDTIGEMKDDYVSNPWNNSSIKFLSNELRHDIGARLPVLIDKLKKYHSSIKAIFNDMNLHFDISYSNINKAKNLFSISKESPIVPVKWLTDKNIISLFDEISECEEKKIAFINKKDELKSVYNEILKINTEVVLSSPDDLDSIEKIQNEKETISKFIADNQCYSLLRNNYSVDTCISEKKTATEYSTEITSLKEEILLNFEEEVFNFDYQPVLTRYKTEYDTIFKYFKSSYKDDKKQIKSYIKDARNKLSDNDILTLLMNLQKIDQFKKQMDAECANLIKVFGNGIFNYELSDFQEMDKIFILYNHMISSIALLDDMEESTRAFTSNEYKLSTNYDFLYKGINTSWSNIRESLKWTMLFKKKSEEYAVNSEFSESVCSDKDTINKCGEYEKRLNEVILDLQDDFNWFNNLFDINAQLEDADLNQLSEHAENCMNNLFLLEKWIDFTNARNDCETEGLNDCVSKIQESKIKSSSIIPIFQKRFFRLWLDSVLPEYQAVLNFRHVNQENTIKEFADLDRMQFEIAKARIKSKLINDLPLLDKFTTGLDEIGILRRELGKQKRIMPLRKLFRQIPNLLMTLKPCLMMSPLSVSLFLEADTYKFDTVIFDEASQVCTENAIGAIFRGKQAIIAGDSKQLPPTNFFNASTSDTDFDKEPENEDDYDDTNAYESILDEANLLPEKTLLWHYRSRHEHLIAFSNAKIYHNSLITFPSNVDNAEDNGVEYYYVPEGYYDRGGKKGNAIEAKRVAGLVFEHFKKHPERSLGVIAFGENQQQAIETEIREMRLRYPGYEPFFNEEKEDAFFVKNLENVQGDERDTIIFSIGYAKDANGVFRMNFGPLSKVGGERRLNVAITRAKYNIKLVGSILPTDINVDKISSEGPKLLRSYIDFAMNGISSLQNEITESDVALHDSPFEKVVYDFLDRKGYKLATQVGCSGYRIDMAVKHPTISGQYVLGIECDGAAYHSARTARERDRLRQDVLENMGWKIYRIWSTDWIKDPITEGKRLIKAVKNALKNDGIIDKTLSGGKINSEDFVSMEEKEQTLEEMTNPYEFKEEPDISLDNLSTDDYGYLNIEDCLVEIVNKRYPIHYDFICQKLAPLFGNEKATVKVRREVDYALEDLNDKIIRKGDFFYPDGYTEVFPYADNTRKITHIATDELAAAMIYILKKNVGFTKDILIAETARAYNFNRITQNINSALNEAFQLLLTEGKITELEGKVDIIK